ncbi:hypothetical protein FHS15_003198 [Paenibacillus castaneae]|uniref:hypothetical protein n=1 Tax=Paenibacillus castaneae TaxID=474957 RepID=UPI000C99D3DA|nr:hypothetical protein [Paenibacillus castaneae]NIK78060.1 hypothetical protein [Paenibacillus castaneae]
MSVSIESNATDDRLILITLSVKSNIEFEIELFESGEQLVSHYENSMNHSVVLPEGGLIVFGGNAGGSF